MTLLSETDRRRVRWMGLASGIAMLGAVIGGAAAAGSTGDDAQPQVEVRPAEAPAGDEIDCLLPAKVERRGSQLTHLGARREVQLPPEECTARGGEIEGDDEQPPEDAPEE